MPLQPLSALSFSLDEKDLSSLSFLRILKVPKIIAWGHNFTWMCLEGGGSPGTDSLISRSRPDCLQRNILSHRGEWEREFYVRLKVKKFSGDIVLTIWCYSFQKCDYYYARIAVYCYGSQICRLCKWKDILEHAEIKYNVFLHNNISRKKSVWFYNRMKTLANFSHLLWLIMLSSESRQFMFED